MSKQLMIRNLSDDTFLQLKSLSKQLGYDSLIYSPYSGQ